MSLVKKLFQVANYLLRWILKPAYDAAAYLRLDDVEAFNRDKPCSECGTTFAGRVYLRRTGFKVK